MRILYVNAADISDSHAGPVVHILEMVRSLSELGVEVQLFCPEPTAAPLIELGSVTLRTSTSGLFRLVRLIIHVLRILLTEDRFDLIYFRADWRLALICVVAKILGIPFVVESNGIPSLEGPKYRLLIKQPWLYLANRWVYRNGLVVLCVTDELAKFVKEKYGVPSERIQVVPNGVNSTHYRPLPLECGLFSTNGRPTIGYLGAFRSWQGIEILVDAIPHMIKSIPELLVLLAGQGKAQGQLERRAKALGVNRYIRWVGAVPYKESPRFVASCDVMVAPLLQNARNAQTGLCPLKILMYMSCAKPFVTSNLPSLEWLRTVKSCVMCEPNNPVDLANKCLKLLSLSPHERLELGMHGRHIAIEKYDWKVVAGRVLGFIEEHSPL